MKNNQTKISYKIIKKTYTKFKCDQMWSYSRRDFTRPLCLSPPTADMNSNLRVCEVGKTSLQILLFDMTTFSTIFGKRVIYEYRISLPRNHFMWLTLNHFSCTLLFKPFTYCLMHKTEFKWACIKIKTYTKISDL